MTIRWMLTTRRGIRVAKVTGRQISQELCEALGLDPKDIQSLDIHMSAGEFVMVETVQFAEFEGVKEVISILRRYRLEEIPVDGDKSEVTSETVPFDY
jgi:hypothetical protein